MARRISLPQSTGERLAHWYSESFLQDVHLLQGSVIGWVFGLFGQAAVTFAKEVHLTPRAPDLESVSGTALLGHECYHVLQQREMGWWRFLARYLWHWRPSHVRQGWQHPLEKPAYERGEEIRRALEG